MSELHLKETDRKARLKEFFTLLSKNSLQLVDEFYADQAIFQDPIGEKHGVVALRHYYENLYKHVDSIRFDFGPILGEDQDISAVWTMHLMSSALNRGAEIQVHGISFLQFDPVSNKVHYHRDYFDLHEFVYQYIPVLGRLTGYVNSRLDS